MPSKEEANAAVERFNSERAAMQPKTPRRFPGWYPDPDVEGQQRWWTGVDWGDAIQVPVQQQPPGYQQPQPQVIVVGRQKRPVNHLLHFVLSIVTFGLWLPVWLIIAIAA